MADNAAAFTGSIPQYYDRHMGPILFQDYAAAMARRAAAYRPAKVLEIAAGTGIVTRQLRDALPAQTALTATDLNPPMLDVAREKFGPGEQVEFRPADATSLPFADGSFDLVVCQFGVMFYPDKDKSYREASRVLVPGGHYLFSVWDTHRYNAFGRIVHEFIGSLFPDDPPQFMTVPFSYRFDDIRDSAIAAGFTDLTAHVVGLRKTLPDARRFARGAIYGSPLIDSIKNRGDADPETIVDELTRRFHAAFGPDPAAMPLQAIFYSATKPA